MKLGYILLYVEDVEETMAFYSRAFGLEVGFLHESKDYGEMKTGETKLGFVNHCTASSHGFEYEKLNLKAAPPGVEVAFVVENVEEAYGRALHAGALVASPPAKKSWGQVVSYVRDCNGLLVEICSAV